MATGCCGTGSVSGAKLDGHIARAWGTATLHRKQCPVQLRAHARAHRLVCHSIVRAPLNVKPWNRCGARYYMPYGVVFSGFDVPSHPLINVPSYLAPDFSARWHTKPSGCSLTRSPFHLSLHTMRTPPSSLLAATAGETSSSRGVSSVAIAIFSHPEKLA